MTQGAELVMQDKVLRINRGCRKSWDLMREVMSVWGGTWSEQNFKLETVDLQH